MQFVFDDEALEVLVKSKESENKFVGGQNRWSFDSFTNWEFWWKGFPVLVYFKVRQCHLVTNNFLYRPEPAASMMLFVVFVSTILVISCSSQ